MGDIRKDEHIKQYGKSKSAQDRKIILYMTIFIIISIGFLGLMILGFFWLFSHTMSI